MKFDAIPGYDESATERMPHAWKAGAQTVLLRDQLAAMPEGGTFLMSVPDNSLSLSAGPLRTGEPGGQLPKRHNPTGKVVIVDAKDSFPKQALFTEGWKKLYPGMIRHVPFSETAGITEVSRPTRWSRTAFETFKGDVVNVIPPQSAARILLQAGLAGDGDWCLVDQGSFEIPSAPGIHVLGDAAFVGDMPKSGYAAAEQGRVCAQIVAGLLLGTPAKKATLQNACYSFVAPDYGISATSAYALNAEGRLAPLMMPAG